ncbi:glycosyltransferase [Shouchella shacheensis]|uniref:glycosyltransferase n=1 Tax=Shouchella shacheensis TaxID=1649580 RepID=UPI00074045EF|nr:glycosyltransferase [Shouchella shacheensis]
MFNRDTIKCIHLITDLKAGGAEMMLYKTVKGLSNEFEPIVVSLMGEGPVSKLIEKENIKLYHLNLTKNKLSMVSALLKLFKIIKKERPAIIHSYMFHADLFGRIVGTFLRVPVIISSIRNENVGGKAREKIMRYTDFAVKKVTAVCYSAAEAQINKRSIKKEKLEVIYNGVETQLYGNTPKKDILALRKSLGIPGNSIVFINVGRLERQKHQLLLIEAFAAVAKKNRNIYLVIVGAGELGGILSNRSEELNVKNNVIFTGLRNDVQEILQLANCFVLSSSWEGMPNVVLEAMASRIPVIGTSVGGTPEIIEEGCGLLVPRDDLVAMEGALNTYLKMPENEIQLMIDKAYDRIKQVFSIDNTIAETEALYKRLLTK